MSVKKINNDEFNLLIKENIVVVDFFATWCGPCKMLSPIVEELSNEITGVTFAKIDIDEFPNLATSYGIMSIPTIIIFKNGQMINKTVGFLSKSELKQFIEQNI